MYKRNINVPYRELIDHINAMSVRDLSDMELRTQIAQRVQVPNTFALIKEVIFRLKGIRLFDTQLATAISLYQGRIAELPTGEGKTLAAVLPAALYALEGKRVHVLTFNDYLAKRDHLLNWPIYEFCGLKSGHISQEMSCQERKKAYDSDILYLTVKEAGFDYLRDFLSKDSLEVINPSKDVAIIDEADSILIDEARIPLIIAGTAGQEDIPWQEIARNVRRLVPTVDFDSDKVLNQIWLTDQGTDKLETLLKTTNLYSSKNSLLLAAVHTALQAQFLLVRDRDYVIKGDMIHIIDEYTGRVAEGRRYPSMLQRAVEAKEDLPPTYPSKVFNSITIQHYLSLYKKLCGMTGTVASSAGELRDMYGLEVDVIPPHCPCIRTDLPDCLYATKSEKYNAVVKEVALANTLGQPVLIGTASIQESETLAALLESTGITPWVLNAKNDEREAELIARAGEPYRVTVSTNMAGRGVDIKLGGPKETCKEPVVQSGGLYVIGTNRHESIRIDNQLRGRAGRQGDVGKTRFFVSQEDDLLVQNNFHDWIPLKIYTAVQRHGSSDPQASAVIDKMQRFSEGTNAQAREMLSKFSLVIEEQRRIITRQHSGILNGEIRLGLLAAKEPEYYGALVASLGQAGVDRAEQQLALHLINEHWADYLEYMGTVREGIHLTLVGKRDPLDEYYRIAITAFEAMQTEIKTDLVSLMKQVKIGTSGVDMEAEGLSRSSITWTYLIDDSAYQFSCLPQLLNGVSKYMKRSLFTISGLIHKLNEKKYHRRQ